ncbi:MAG: hypothetical protein ACKODH_07875 [Limisphaerales bacterium]
MHASSASSAPAQRATLLLAGLLVLVLRIRPTRPAGAAEVPVTQSWSGNWNYRKYNTTGALTCTVVGEQNGQWIAKFTGTALGKPISYTALMTPKASGTDTALSGTTKVDGFDYQWSATLAGKSLNGSYRASNGNNGEFRLQPK